ncbi:hypothetical protein PFICI_03969 [Pestalotiopsis fici W106-1]|uniref:Casein kinase substrate phosphoprotein PP28 domain-containing protein n=1 Tax=Pestalotiopsis fici (strain W106-1 / CGMCC3.15140) TaxID=1229662 RepID=W3XIV5_PESFW|nr:uncharacterized protein PFICI_03969 [Pestalotiopsis fici W106-1]ETS85944.1 hypothetical protein PFICI_03969 [Pestalotiopsis fici W106-1]
MAGGTGKAGGAGRGRGGKFKKFTRGGGHHFSRDLRPLDADGNEVSMWSADKQEDSDDSSEEDSSSEESSEEDSDDAGPAKAAPTELTREERKKQKAAQKAAAVAKKNKGVVQVGDLPSDSEESDDDMPANPNHSKAARNMAKEPRPVEEVTEGVKKLTTSTAGMSRKERESMEAAQAKERYRKLHEAGKTDEAKADLARLKVIRERREAEAARKQAEKEERDAQEADRKKEIEAKEAKKREAAMGKPAKKGKK